MELLEPCEIINSAFLSSISCGLKLTTGHRNPSLIPTAFAVSVYLSCTQKKVSSFNLESISIQAQHHSPTPLMVKPPEKALGTSKPAVNTSPIPTVKPLKSKCKSPSPPKAHLSAEFVHDSSDNDAPAKSPVKVAKAVEKETKTPEKKEKKEKVKPAVVEVSSDSSSDEEESDEKITKGVTKSESRSKSSNNNSSDKEKVDSDSNDSESSSVLFLLRQSIYLPIHY